MTRAVVLTEALPDLTIRSEVIGENGEAVQVRHDPFAEADEQWTCSCGSPMQCAHVRGLRAAVAEVVE